MKTLGAFVILLTTLSSPSFSETTKVEFSNNSDTSESTYDWTGPYVGGFVGISKGGSASNPEFAFMIIHPSDPWNKGSEEDYINHIYDEDRGARYYEVTSPDSQSSDPMSLGFNIGYNLHVKNAPIWMPNVLGVEGAIGTIGLSVSKSITDFESSTPDAQGVMGEGRNGYTNEIRGFYKFIGGKVGYAVSKSLYYVKGGYFFTQSESTLELQNILSFERKKSEERNLAFGFGLERAFEKINGRQTSIFLEYMNVDLNNTSILEYNDPLGCVPPQCYPLTNRNLPAGIQFDYQRLQTIKVGMNVRF